MNWDDKECLECRQESNEILDKSITVEEIHREIDNLPLKKSWGIDAIANKIIRNAKRILGPLLCRLFNCILERGKYPDSWCKSLIVSIHKGGSVNDMNNYRGISLLTHIGKLFCRIYNSRIRDWANRESLMFEEQGGYTKGKGTIDQIFILNTVIDKYLQKKEDVIWCL